MLEECFTLRFTLKMTTNDSGRLRHRKGAPTTGPRRATAGGKTARRCPETIGPRATDLGLRLADVPPQESHTGNRLAPQAFQAAMAFPAADDRAQCPEAHNIRSRG